VVPNTSGLQRPPLFDLFFPIWVVPILLKASDFPDEVWRRLGRPFVSICLGTGFKVDNRGYAMTVLHIVQTGLKLIEGNSDIKQANKKQVSVGLVVPNPESKCGNLILVDFHIVYEDSSHDLALLKLRNNPFNGQVRSHNVVGDKEIPVLFGVPTLNSQLPANGLPVAVSGYLSQTNVLVTSTGTMATSLESEITESVQPGQKEGVSTLQLADLS
jgi:S1-C subfamily serine protease